MFDLIQMITPVLQKTEIYAAADTSCTRHTATDNFRHAAPLLMHPAVRRHLDRRSRGPGNRE